MKLAEVHLFWHHSSTLFCFSGCFFYSFFAKANMENEGVEDDCPFQKSKCDFLGSMLNFVGSKLFNFDGTVGLVCALWFVQIAGDS